MTLSGLDRAVQRRLGDRDVRYTRGRKIVVDALAGLDGPKSAAELHSLIGPEVPLSSLYRSLTVLEEAEVVIPHFGSGGVTRYELAEWLSGHHHHLICVSCGAVEDIALPSVYERQVHELIDHVGALTSFEPSSHALEIEGRCARCS